MLLWLYLLIPVLLAVNDNQFFVNILNQNVSIQSVHDKIFQQLIEHFKKECDDSSQKYLDRAWVCFERILKKYPTSVLQMWDEIRPEIEYDGIEDNTIVEDPCEETDDYDTPPNDGPASSNCLHAKQGSTFAIAPPHSNALPNTLPLEIPTPKSPTTKQPTTTTTRTTQTTRTVHRTTSRPTPPPSSHNAFDCNKLRDPQDRHHCQKLKKWDKEARKIKKVKKPRHPPGISQMIAYQRPDLALIESQLHVCMTFACVCEHLEDVVVRDGQCFMYNKTRIEKAIRKEYRTLTAEERKRFHDTLWEMHESSEYHQFVRHHFRADRSGAAHAGPAYLLFHREYLKRFELALRSYNFGTALPYIDWTLDDALDNPEDSILFSEHLLGETPADGGFIMNGRLKGWGTLEGNEGVKRKLGQIIKGTDKKFRPTSSEMVDHFLNSKSIDQIFSYSFPHDDCPYKKPIDKFEPEYAFGRPFAFVGGDMDDFKKAGSDPLFFMHHAFFDNLFEQWRKNHLNLVRHGKSYPNHNDLRCSSSTHFGNQTLHPFLPKKITDVLSDLYTENLYTYAPRPTCSISNTNGCNSEFLFCDLSHHDTPRCSSKIRAGKQCEGYRRGENPCYHGSCENGICKEDQSYSRSKTTHAKNNITNDGHEKCYNQHPCCEPWKNEGRCQSNPSTMDEECSASCGKCAPKAYTLLDDCSDRYSKCEEFANQGKCDDGDPWIDENCRRSCSKCTQTRTEQCKSKTKFAFSCKKASTECHNEYPCCSYWANRGECSVNKDFMECYCPVSCKKCIPKYKYGECDDYAPYCSARAATECKTNYWMTENCRKSCNSCHLAKNPQQECPKKSGSMSKPVSSFSLPSGFVKSRSSGTGSE